MSDAESPKTEHIVIGCFFFAVVSVGSLLAILVIANRQRPNPPSKPSPVVAYSTACDEVRARLKSPGSATFAGYGNATVSSTGENRWKITSYVNATNSFNANIRTAWTATVEYRNGQYEVSRVAIE